MAACERCWDDAFIRHMATGESQADAYRFLVLVRNADPRELRKCEEYQQAQTRLRPS